MREKIVKNIDNTGIKRMHRAVFQILYKQKAQIKYKQHKEHKDSCGTIFSGIFPVLSVGSISSFG